jgi:hypothetical protein
LYVVPWTAGWIVQVLYELGGGPAVSAGVPVVVQGTMVETVAVDARIVQEKHGLVAHPTSG